MGNQKLYDSRPARNPSDRPRARSLIVWEIKSSQPSSTDRVHRFVPILEIFGANQFGVIIGLSPEQGLVSGLDDQISLLFFLCRLRSNRDAFFIVNLLINHHQVPTVYSLINYHQTSVKGSDCALARPLYLVLLKSFFLINSCIDLLLIFSPGLWPLTT